MIKKKKKRKNTISNNLPNDNKIVNIKSFIDDNGNPTLGKKDGYFNLPFYMDNTIFYNDTEYNKFIKAVEKMVRTSDYYKEYIATLKINYGLNYCMMLGNIDDSEGVDIEMHHGPLMNLYDVVSLITNHRLFNNQPVSTFEICNIVLQEHFKHHVEVIMLSKTVHEMVHAGKLFIHPSMCIGDINALLETYKDGLTKELAEGINKYLELASKYKASDNGYLISSGIKSWNKSNDNFDDIDLDE